jgi:hypothetical protein
MLARISEGSNDIESFVVESENEDAKDRPWRPSHVVFGKSTIKQGKIDAMRGRYFRDISIVRTRGVNNVPLPEADEVVVYRSFMKAGLRFPLEKLLVEVLKTFEIYLHQLTPEAIIKMGIFIWAMMSHPGFRVQSPGANIITRCAGTKSHTYDESWHRIECHIFTI